MSYMHVFKQVYWFLFQFSTAVISLCVSACHTNNGKTVAVQWPWTCCQLQNIVDGFCVHWRMRLSGWTHHSPMNGCGKIAPPPKQEMIYWGWICFCLFSWFNRRALSNLEDTTLPLVFLIESAHSNEMQQKQSIQIHFLHSISKQIHFLSFSF